MSKKPEPEQITLTFDLHDLPTAQHRAGLAGLILQIDSMGEKGNRRPKKNIPVIDEAKLTSTSATIAFTRDSMQGVFDDLYAAKTVEVVVAAKWPGETKPKPGEFFLSKKDPKTGESKQVPGFAYDVVQPLAPCLSRHLPDDHKNSWHELWRQMVWAIPRGGNNVRSRAPFNDVAAGKPCGEGATAWTQIVELQEKQAKSQFLTAPISGALMLGAQAVNAESVPFAGRVDHNLLLHFWQVVVFTFVPQVVSKKDAKIERVGYVLAIPDVADLRVFRWRFPEILGDLRHDEHPGTPKAAKIDLPDQASLEVLRRLKERDRGDEPATVPRESSARVERSEKRLPRRNNVDRVNRTKAIRDLAASRAGRGWGDCVRAIESYHMFKLGNNVKLLSFSRLADRPGLIEDYQDLDKNYRSPLFRAALLRALIRDEPWHSRMIELFAEYPWTFFMEVEDTPKYLPRFGRDARDLFRAFSKATYNRSLEEMDHEAESKILGVILQRLIDRYVERRAEKKTGIDVSKLPKAVVRNKQGEPVKKKKTDEDSRPSHLPEGIPRGPTTYLQRCLPGDALAARSGLRLLLRRDDLLRRSPTLARQLSIPDPNPDDQP